MILWALALVTICIFHMRGEVQGRGDIFWPPHSTTTARRHKDRKSYWKFLNSFGHMFYYHLLPPILKINFRHLFPNFWSLLAETCSVATKSKQAKILLIGIPRWPQWFHSIEQGGRQLKTETLQTTSRPCSMARFQNICTEVFLQ